MDDRIRKRAYSSPKHTDVFEEVFEEFEGFETTDPAEVEFEDTQVKESNPDDAIRAGFTEPVPEQEDDFELGTIREKAHSHEEIDFQNNEGVEFSEGSDSVIERAQKLQKVNSQLEEQGVRRQYVLSESDAPENAFVHKDSIGDYFYEMPFRVRPSNVTKVVEEDSWFELSENERVVATVMLLDKSYPWALQDAKSERAVESLLERTLVLETDDLESEDVYSVSMKENLKSLLSDR